MGGDSRTEAYIQRDRRNQDDIQILGDSLRLICAADSEALVVKAVHTPFLPDLESARERALPYRAVWEPAQGGYDPTDYYLDEFA